MQEVWRTVRSLIVIGLLLTPAWAEQPQTTAPPAPAPAAPAAPTLSVARDVVATSVVDRAPQGAAETFPPTIHAVYYFTEIHGAEGPAAITHRWLYQDQVMAEVKLEVGGSPWRTWSSKTILPEWTGTWRVEVLTEAGQVLASKSFTIQ